MATGVSKSGSPTPNAKTRCPASRSLAARAAIAKVALGATEESREASRVVTALRKLPHPDERRYPGAAHECAFFSAIGFERSQSSKPIRAIFDTRPKHPAEWGEASRALGLFAALVRFDIDLLGRSVFRIVLQTLLEVLDALSEPLAD